MVNSLYANFNSTVSLCRIIGMFMIIICHIGTSVGSSVIGQFFQSGVQLFLLISGYLYSKKQIVNEKKWFIARWIKVSIPSYIWIFLMSFCCLIIKVRTPFSVLLLSLFNLQGYYHLITFLPHINMIPGTAHLWFVSTIILCYLLTIFLKKYELRRCFRISYKQILLYGLAFCVILGCFGIQFFYIWMYFAGYAMGKRKKSITTKQYLVILLCTIAALLLRLVFKQYCDVKGDNNLYLYVVIPLVYNMMAICIFYSIDLINNKFEVIKIFGGTLFGKMLFRLDAISFFVYITHYSFIDAPFSVINLTSNYFVNIFVLIILIAISSFLLETISQRVSTLLINVFNIKI